MKANKINMLVAQAYSRPDVDMFYPKNPSEEADFCLNRCPHPDKPCRGTCPEYRAWEEAKIKEKMQKAKEKRNAMPEL